MVKIKFHKTLASFLSLSINSSTLPTKTPPSRSIGALTSSITTLGAVSKPRSSSAITSTLFFFAFKIDLTLANLGVLSLKSQVKTAGSVTEIFYNPKSTSLRTTAWLLSSENAISELKLAVGMFMREPRICPV
jgi:hypothetical protein